jgi:hypothetical protein
VQTTGGPPTHVPLTHVSLVEQAFPSLQVVPSGAEGFEQTPVDGLHTPGKEHGPEAVQVTGLLPTQVPF